MKTYQDLLDCGQDEQRRAAFVLEVVNRHQQSELYKQASTAKLYYQGENPTINEYEKVIYDLKGKAHRDMYTANHKIASHFFSMVVDQQVSYLLGNGVSFRKEDTHDRLGQDFDRKISRAAVFALVGGVAFGLWDLDHVQLFEITEFVPLYDEQTGALMAGVRFWRLAENKPLHCTLYELDGFTGYTQQEKLEITQPKRAYQLRVTGSQVESITQGQNYPSFPIVPLRNNPECKNELTGRRNTIDALDLARSNMVNNVDEGNLIYWAIKDCGGMSDLDMVQFIERLKTLHVADTNGEGSAEPHAIEAPFQGTQTTIDMLEKTLYQDFMAFDSAAVTAGNQTATAIKASYVPLDLKCDQFEHQVTEFIQGILRLAGIDDQPTYTRNKITNTQEEVQTLLLGADYLDKEYITRKLLTILGDADMADQVLERRAAEGMEQFTQTTKEETT